MVAPGIQKRAQIPRPVDGLASPKGKDSQKTAGNQLQKEPPQATPSIEPNRRLRKQPSNSDLLQRQSSAKSLDLRLGEKKLLHSSSSQIIGLKEAKMLTKNQPSKKQPKGKKLRVPLLVGHAAFLGLPPRVLLSPAMAKGNYNDDYSKYKKVPQVNSSRGIPAGINDSSHGLSSHLASEATMGVAAISPQMRNSRGIKYCHNKLLSVTELMSHRNLQKLPSKQSRPQSPVLPRLSTYL